MKPLNGEYTHPLTKAGRDALFRLMMSGYLPTQEFNPGIVNRLLREPSVELVDLPSPYKTKTGQKCPHLRIKLSP